MDEIIPSCEWSSLSECAGWPALTVGQQRSIVVLFDVYSERMWDPRSDVPVRTLTEKGWKRAVRDILVEGPKRRPLLPLQSLYSLYKTAATERPSTCPMPAWTPVENATMRHPPLHLDFIALVILLSTVADAWKKLQSPLVGLLQPGAADLGPDANGPSSLGEMLHTISIAICDAAEAEGRLASRQIHRATPRAGPKLKLWDFLQATEPPAPSTSDKDAGRPAESGGTSIARRSKTASRTSSSNGSTMRRQRQRSALTSGAMDAAAAAGYGHPPVGASAGATHAEIGEIGGVASPKEPYGVASPKEPYGVAAVRIGSGGQGPLMRRSGLGASSSSMVPRPTRPLWQPPSASHQAAQLRRLNATLKESRSELSGLRDELLSDLRAEVRSVVRAELAVASASLHAVPSIDGHGPATPAPADGSAVCDGAVGAASKPPYAISGTASDDSPASITAPLDVVASAGRRGRGESEPRQLQYNAVSLTERKYTHMRDA